MELLLTALLLQANPKIKPKNEIPIIIKTTKSIELFPAD